MIAKKISKTFQSRIEQEIAELKESTSAIKEELRVSSESCASPLGDTLDCAKDERELKSKIEIYNHSLGRLSEFQGALSRINHGSFGFCHNCGDHIGERRLHARPGATFCIGCQEESELSQGMTRNHRIHVVPISHLIPEVILESAA